MDTPHFTTSALTLGSEETALRGQPRRLPRLRGKGGAAGRGAALHEVEFPIKRKAGQTCASLRPGRFLTTTTPGGQLPRFTLDVKRPSAASNPAFSAGAPAALLAVRPTATACGRGARPQRPGSWGLQAAPYAPPLRGRAPPLPPLAVRPAQTTAALQENKERAEQLRPVLLTKGTLATAPVL